MIPEPAIEAVAKYLADEAFDWVDLDDHDHTLECTNWEAYTVEARLALEAALPHIRKQVASEIRSEVDKLANLGSSGLGEHLTGMLVAASIAEKGTDDE